MNRPDIYVESEWADLKEVIVGVPLIVYPDLRVARWVEDAMKILPESEILKAKDRSGKDSISLGKFDCMEEENRELISIFEQYGVKVWRPEVLTRERIAKNFGAEFLAFAGASQQYVRDPILVIGDNVIETAMGSLYRRCDILGLRTLLKNRVIGSNARWAAMPGLDYSMMTTSGADFDKTVFPVLEGGDVIVLGKNIFVGNSQNKSTGSSELGYLWLQSYLAPQEYYVEQVRLREDILHLDVVLSVPKPGLLIVCPEAFLDGVPKFFDGWNRLEVTLEDARYLAVNGLSINKCVYIIGINENFNSKKLQEGLEREGISVIAIGFGHHTEDGGSIRCSTHPLVRCSG